MRSMKKRLSPTRYLIALDIDGTLTNSKKELTPRTSSCLLRLQEEGARLALASGRPTYGAEPLARDLRLSKYGGFILSYNGGKITDCATGRTLFRQQLPEGAVPRLAALRDELSLELLTYEGTCIVTEHPENPYVQKEAAINRMEVRRIASFADYVSFPVTKCLMVGEGSYLASVEAYAAERLGDGFSVYRSEPYFLEIVPKGIDKARSLERLLRRLSMGRENLIAFGDGYNDISMLRYAGLGFAMANASEAVRQAADRVAPSNDEDGAARSLEELFPQPPEPAEL